MSDINQGLQELDDRLSEGFIAPRWPILAIVAFPRAGSTLLQQVLISRLTLGYVSNICARFSRAPVVGALLQKSLASTAFRSSFWSEYGLTEGPEEPHEWGHFWRHWLALEGDQHYCEDVGSLSGLPSKLAAMEAVLEAPLIFDNVFLMSNLKMLKDTLPNIVVLHIKRSPFFVCNSILKARLKRYGSIDYFYGHRPRDFEALIAVEDPVEQVVRQVASIKKEIDQSLSNWPSEGLIEIEYENLIAHPETVSDRLTQHLESLGCPVTRKVQVLPEFQSRNDQAEVNEAWRDRLSASFEQHFDD